MCYNTEPRLYQEGKEGRRELLDKRQGSGTFNEVKIPNGYLGLSGWPKSSHKRPSKGEGDSVHTGGNATTELQTGGHGHTSSKTNSHQRLEEARTRFLPRAPRGAAALQTAWLQSSDIDLRLPASKTVRE